MVTMRTLFIVPYPIEGPSTRYRVEQYLPYLREYGLQIDVARFIASSDFYSRMFQPGRHLQKAAYVAWRMARRLADALRAKRYDVILIQREAMPYGPPLIERLIFRSGVPVVYDFDDAIYIRRSSAANRRMAWLKQPQKTAELVARSAHVIAGNRILADYARQFNTAVSIIPTPIDTTRYTVRQARQSTTLTIGWVGTLTNSEYLHSLDEALTILNGRFPFTLTVIGGKYSHPVMLTINRPWRLEDELADLHEFDVGVMPLPDTEWTRGKCGFKILQYMAAGVPCVASPVGVNADIIQSGVNGFLADSPAEWVEALTQLAQSATLRQQIGLAGRATVEADYSLQKQLPRLLTVLQQTARER
jgi:glycosyltransferase involved in cell wall biosynthesis